MEEAIKNQLGSKQPSEMVELNLDNVKATSITGLNAEDFVNLSTLSFVNVGLTSLEGLPNLPKLISIDLSENKLTGENGIFSTLAESCPHLCRVNLCSNDIKTADVLEPLAKLEHLEYLDIFECPVANTDEKYRAKVFELIPQLKYLDNFDINNVEADDDFSDEGDEDLDDEHLDDEDEELLSDEIDDESGEEAEESVNGLAYLNSSKALQDEDESEDYNNENSADAVVVSSSISETRTNKRKHESGEESNDAVETKKVNGANGNGVEPNPTA